MILSPLLKFEIPWKAECLADDSLESIGNERLRDRGDGSTVDVKFKLRSAIVVERGIEWRATGRTSWDDVLLLTCPWPRVKSCVGFSVVTGTTTGLTFTGKVVSRGNPLGLQDSGGAGGNGRDWDALSWWCTCSSSIGLAETWGTRKIGLEDKLFFSFSLLKGTQNFYFYHFDPINKT